MAAARALSRGDWEKAYTFITALKMWALVPNSDGVKAMLKGKLQEEGLRTYLFTYSTQYKALSLDQLCKMFCLPVKKVRCSCCVIAVCWWQLLKVRSCWMSRKMFCLPVQKVRCSGRFGLVGGRNQ